MEKAHEVYWSEAAAEGLKAIIEYIRADYPPAAKESLGKIQSKTAALRSFPQRGRIVPELKAHGILQYRELVNFTVAGDLPYFRDPDLHPVGHRFPTKRRGRLA